MSEQWQKIQLELALPGVREGEARTARGRGTESLMAEGATESPATERMMEEIGEAGNLSKALQRVMASISAFITRHLKLKVNVEKSAVGRPWERKFLSFRSADSPSLREIAPKAVARFKHQVRQITRRARGVSIDRVVKDLRPYLCGWKEYFGWCETPWLLRDLDKWVRYRLRCYLWVQWRTPRR